MSQPVAKVKVQTAGTAALRLASTPPWLESLLYRLLSIALLIAVWYGVSWSLSEMFVPGPRTTLQALIKQGASGALARHFWATMNRMLVSFSIAMAIGISLGIVMGLSRRAERLLDLWVMVGLTIPSLCYVIVAFMWLGLNDRAAALAIALTTFPPIAINIWQGVKSIEQPLIDMARAFRASPWRRLTRVILPQVYPHLMAALRFGLGVVWKVTVLVELLGRSNGVGYMLNHSFQLFNMADVFAWTLFFTLFMLLVEVGLLKPLERRLFRWRPEVRG